MAHSLDRRNRWRRAVVRLAVSAAVTAMAGAGCSSSTNSDGADGPTVTVAGQQVTYPPGTTVAPTTVATTTTAPPPLRWVALGDSYSAGIGASRPIDRTDPNCARDLPGSYPSVAADRLRSSGRPVDLQMLACDGGTIARVVDRQLPLAGRADLITVTMGGNDLGFSQVIAECLIERCRSYDQPDDRFPGFAHQVGSSDWEVLEGRLMTGLAAMYATLAADGQVLILTYPLPFSAQPDSFCLLLSAPLDPSSQLLANAAIFRLNLAIAHAAETVNASADRDFVTVLDWQQSAREPVREFTDDLGHVHLVDTNPNGICSPEPWLVGISATELGDSFHPTDAGHARAAEQIVDWISRS